MSRYWKIPLSHLLFFAGAAVSYPMAWFAWGWLYSLYSWLMCCSAELDEWDAVWTTVPDEDGQE